MKHLLQISLILLVLIFAVSAAQAISQEEEIKIGRDTVMELRSQGFSSEPALNQIGLAVSGVVERQDLPWHFWVLEEPKALNAFALPGGFVFITRRYYEMLNTDELAFVVGHEMAHIDKRHFEEKMRRARRARLYDLLAGIIIHSTKASSDWYTVADLGATAYFTKYSRKLEREADLWGYRYTRNSGFDAEQAVSALGKLGGDKKDPIFGTIFNTHPLLSSREDRLEAMKTEDEAPPPPRPAIEKIGNPDWKAPSISKDDLKSRPGIAVRIIGENQERWNNDWRGDFRRILFFHIEAAGKYDVKAEDRADSREAPRLSDLREKDKVDKLLLLKIQELDVLSGNIEGSLDHNVLANIRIAATITDTATGEETALPDIVKVARGRDFLPVDEKRLYPDMTLTQAILDISRELAARISPPAPAAPVSTAETQ